MHQCILITLLPPPPKKKNKKQKTKQKKISVFKNGIIECATVSHSAGLFGFLEILFWLYLDPLCLSWILRQAFYGAFGFFKDRKCGGVPKVFNFKFLIPCVHASEITNRTFFNISTFLLNFSGYGKNLNKNISLTYFAKSSRESGKNI